MEIQFWQIILLSLLAFYGIVDALQTSIISTYPVIIGTIAGIIMGDIKTGLAVGATLQLMVLGMGTYGGASIPDYMTGAIVGTAFAVISGKGTEFGIGLAVPVGLLMVQLDILARFSNVFFQRRIEKAIEEVNLKSLAKNTWLGMLPWGLSRAVPVFLMLFFGENLINLVLEYMPEWLMGGLGVAGGLLPAVGIAILLRYLPMKEFVSYLLIGFITAAYLKVPMVGIAILGLALGIISYKNTIEKASMVGKSIDNNTSEGVTMYDGEYED